MVRTKDDDRHFAYFVLGELVVVVLFCGIGVVLGVSSHKFGVPVESNVAEKASL